MRVAVCPRWITSHVNVHKAIVTHSASNMLPPPCYRTYQFPGLLVTAISTTVILTQCEGRWYTSLLFLLYFTCIVPNEWITIKSTFWKVWKELTAVPCFPSVYGNLQDSSSVLHTTLDMMGKTVSYNVPSPFLHGKPVPSITLKGLPKSFSWSIF